MPMANSKLGKINYQKDGWWKEIY